MICFCDSFTVGLVSVTFSSISMSLCAWSLLVGRSESIRPASFILTNASMRCRVRGLQRLCGRLDETCRGGRKVLFCGPATFMQRDSCMAYVPRRGVVRGRDRRRLRASADARESGRVCELRRRRLRNGGRSRGEGEGEGQEGHRPSELRHHFNSIRFLCAPPRFLIYLALAPQRYVLQKLSAESMQYRVAGGGNQVHESRIYSCARPGQPGEVPSSPPRWIRSVQFIIQVLTRVCTTK